MSRSVGKVLAAVLAAAGVVGCRNRPPPAEPRRPLRMLVMDPLAGPLACDCVAGFAQRNYGRLGEFLEGRLARPVEIAYAESLGDVLRGGSGPIDLVIGKRSVVVFDAARAKMAVHPIAALTDKTGSTDLTGLIVVRSRDPAASVADLKGRRILLGPVEADEKHSAAKAALRAAGVPLPAEPLTKASCNAAALAVAEGQADAAVISSYALPLLEGCDVIDKGVLRVLGRTRPVPFVTVFATESLPPEAERAVVEALLGVRTDPKLLAEMESKDGFVRLAGRRAVAWTDWRGPGRDGLCPAVPKSLPAKARFLWRRPMTNVALSGIAATAQYVIVADKDKQATQDIWRCLDADTGREIWSLQYPAGGEMDYSNSPRATPVVHGGMAYLLGAFGDLHCVALASGNVVWRTNVIKAFAAELPAWGMCSTPLIVDDKLILNPGGKDAAVVALDRRTGQVIWKTPGREAAYSSFIVGTFGGVRQVVGYDSVSVGGWDVRTGKRLWELLPPEEGDFNVPTPIDVAGKLLLASENNGTRLYGFDARGRIVPKPLAVNAGLAPDAATPVVLGRRVFGVWGDLFCLDLAGGLKTIWKGKDELFDDYASLVAGNGRVLVTTITGELLLIDAEADRFRVVSRLKPFKRTEVWSHPALVGDRLYIRNRSAVVCLLLGDR